MRLWIVFLLVVIFSVPLHAGEDDSQHHMSITISPFHLFNPELHLTGEFRLAAKTSVAAMLGAGAVTDEGTTYGIWEVGGQIRYYLFGSFTRGMMLGADVGYTDVNGSMANPMAYYIGLRAGGFLGYKIVFKSGFTGEVQYGPLYVRESAENSEMQTLINLKIGWSF